MIDNENDPICCPKCGSKNLAVDLVNWSAKSLDDPQNITQLTEHQCLDCAVSFWM